MTNVARSLDLVYSLNAREAELEREHGDVRRKVERIRLLPQAFGRIAAQREPELVVAQMLATACELLGFERAIFFACEGNALRATQVLERGEASRAENVAVSPASSPSFATAQAGALVSGRSTDLSAPLVDVRDCYFLSALIHATEPYGFLYVDGPGRDSASESETLRDLSLVGAVASRSALRLQQAQDRAARDSLTGLLNRRTLGERLEHLLVCARRHGSSLAYVLLDLDDFKEINDRAGHAAGDAHLRKFANALLAMSRAEDVVARFAGDEFVIVQARSEPRAERSGVARISELLALQGFRCSLGAAVYPRDGLDAQTLFAAADRALYEAKRSGKNGFAFA